MRKKVDPWETQHAAISWCPRDVFELARLEMAPPEMLRDFLIHNEDAIQQAMIEVGGDVIRQLWYAQNGPMTRIIR